VASNHILLIPDLTQVIGYFLQQVLAVYGLLSNFQEGFVMNNILFVSSAMIFTWLIFVTCNTAQRATEEVGTLCLFVCLFDCGLIKRLLLKCHGL
jgi:hypothetical protein